MWIKYFEKTTTTNVIIKSLCTVNKKGVSHILQDDKSYLSTPSHIRFSSLRSWQQWVWGRPVHSQWWRWQRQCGKRFWLTRQSGGLAGQRRQSGGLTGQRRQSGGLTGQRRQSGGLTGQRRQSGSLCHKLLNHLVQGVQFLICFGAAQFGLASFSCATFSKVSRSLLVWETVSSTRLSCAALCRLSSSSVIASRSMTSCTAGSRGRGSSEL